MKAPDWSKAEDEQLLRMRAAGARFKEVSAVLIRRSPDACMARLKILVGKRDYAGLYRASAMRPLPAFKADRIPPFQHPRAAQIGSMRLHIAMQQFFARRALAAAA